MRAYWINPVTSSDIVNKDFFSECSNCGNIVSFGEETDICPNCKCEMGFTEEEAEEYFNKNFEIDDE